jgi:hypothetical protein
MGQSELNEQKRAPSIKQSELDLYIKAGSIPEVAKLLSTDLYERLNENVKLIDLSNIPKEQADKIENELLVIPNGNKSKMYQYLLSNKLTKLLESIQEF